MPRDVITGELSTAGRLTGNLTPRIRLSGQLSVGGGVSSYNELSDLPTMNGHTIEGDMTPADLDIWQPKDFSTTEQNTGLKWIDGKDIYRKTVLLSFNTSPYNVPDISGIDTIIMEYGYVKVTGVDPDQYYLPYCDSNDYVVLDVTQTGGIIIYSSSWFYNKSPNGYITFEYTKL